MQPGPATCFRERGISPRTAGIANSFSSHSRVFQFILGRARLGSGQRLRAPARQRNPNAGRVWPSASTSRKSYRNSLNRDWPISGQPAPFTAHCALWLSLLSLPKSSRTQYLVCLYDITEHGFSSLKSLVGGLVRLYQTQIVFPQPARA